MGIGRITASLGFQLAATLRRGAEIRTMSPDRKLASANDPEWRQVFMELLESPAETAFLEAMIDHYCLVPVNGELRSDRMIVQLQVGAAARYRFDFLVNNWLIIEIDGAAYHSSPEAVARDKERDEYCSSRGFTVLRIPAKLVFNSPAVAVAKVGDALAKRRRIYEGKPLKDELKQAATATASFTVRGAKSFASFLEASNRRVDEERAKRSAELDEGKDS